MPRTRTQTKKEKEKEKEKDNEESLTNNKSNYLTDEKKISMVKKSGMIILKIVKMRIILI